MSRDLLFLGKVYLLTFLMSNCRKSVCCCCCCMLYVISESLANITKSPQNVIVLEDENVTLECSTDSAPSEGSSAILWKYDRDPVIHMPCKSVGHLAFVVTSPDSRTDCNIVALAEAANGISGPYECSEGGFSIKSVAMVIVLGK